MRSYKTNINTMNENESDRNSDYKNKKRNQQVTITFGKKATAIFMSTLLSAMLLAGCGASTAAKTNDDYKNQTIYGEVTSVSGDTITIDVGTKDETKTGKTATITVDDDTEITKNQMMGGRGMGGPGENGAPQNGDSNSNNNDSNNNSGSDSDSQSQQGQPSEGAPNNGEAPSGQPPEMPSGEAPSGQPPEMNDDSNKADSSNSDNKSDSSDSENKSDSSDTQQGQPGQGGPGGQMGQGDSIELSDIKEGDTVSITLDENGETDKIEVMSSDNQGGGNGTASANVEYTAVKTYEEDAEVSGETVESTGDDENGILVKGGTVTIDDSTVTRDSDSSTGGDNASFYGVSAAVLGTSGTTKMSDSKITTDAEGGAGVFAYGDSKVYVSDTTIKTTKGASGGIHAAGGGTLYASNLDVETAGQSSAAIRSDRGGGTMIVDGGTYTSTGVGSPAIYSTADITVNDAKLSAEGSEAICIEGKNQVRLFDSTLTGNMSDDKQNDCTWNVILYQSMSGDSEEGTSEFEMDGGTLTAKNGGIFYTTNTSSKFVLKDVDINYAEENDFFLKATGNSNARGWGQSGSNGADCDFTAIDQDMEGDVIWDKISTLDFYMTDGSTLNGAVVKDNSNAGSGKGGSCSVYIDEDSTWTVTGDSTVTNLYNAGTIKDASGNKVTIKGTDGTVYVKGTSKYTITVKTYSTKDKTSSADTISNWCDYEAKMA